MTVELTCTTCGQTKPVDEFGIRSTAANGRRRQCKACIKVRDDRKPSRIRDRRSNPVAPDPFLPTASWIVEREDWQQRGRCQGRDRTAMFFPSKGGNSNLPKLICQGCPVQFQCLEYALRTDQRFGIWGGKSEKERQDIRRRRKQQDAVA